MKRLIAVVLIVLGMLCAAPVALADPYIEQLCQSNPAYRAMHENECDIENGGNGTGSCGLICGILSHIPIVGRLLVVEWFANVS